MKTKYNSTLSTVEAKGGDQTQNYSIRGRWFAVGLGGFLFTSIFALSAPSMEAQCEQYDVSGEWSIIQSNTNYVKMDLRMNGNQVTGTARDSGVRDHQVYIGKPIPVTGTMVANKFNMTVYWEGGTVGVYRGTVDAGGGMKGTTSDKSDPGHARATWYSSKSFLCADAAEPTNPTPVRPPPLKSTGHMPTNPTPSRPPPLKSTGKMPKTQSPTISANPIAVTVPDGESRGATTLTWDAGPDHPDAQVLMKVGIEGEETLVAGRGKGTRRVSVERGKNYQFILTDSGQQLAKAVVISKR